MSDYLATGALPDEYQQLAKTVADFAKTVVAPVAASTTPTTPSRTR